MSELEILARAHALFDGEPGDWRPSGPGESPRFPMAMGRYATAYREAVAASRAVLDHARDTDGELAAILAATVGDHRQARDDTGAVLAAARADPGLAAADNPIAAREALRRSLRRLRSQRAHLRAAQRRARRRQAALRTLRYRAGPGRTGDPAPQAQRAVRAALSKLGCPYVWGATGPDRFDCSGLVQWAYGQAGIQLPRTTYDQISQGIAVPRSQIRPGDLVFPHSGHVQMAIGNNLVVEAPTPGANVQISPLGSSVAIRRPGW